MMHLRLAGVITAVAVLAGLPFLPAEGALGQGDSTGWGTIQGQVTKAGPLPEQKPIPAVKNHQDARNCEAKGPTVDEDWVVNPKNKGVKWAFVWLQADKGKER